MTWLVESTMPHLIVAPVLLAMVSAAVMLLMGEGRRTLKVVIGLTSALLGLSISCVLLAWTHQHGARPHLGAGPDRHRAPRPFRRPEHLLASPRG